MTSLDAALSRISPFGPEYGPSLSSHVPMVLEVLDRVGRDELVHAYLDAWIPRLRPLGDERDPALACYAAKVDEVRARIAQVGPQEVLASSAEELARGLGGAAFHGIIRVGHAARAVLRADTSERRDELARAIAYATSRPLSLGTVCAKARPASFSRALAEVVPSPRAGERRVGLIGPDLTSRLGDGVAHGAACAALSLPDDRDAAVAELRSAALSLYLAPSNHPSADFVLLHGVTAVDAVATLVPRLDAASGATLVGSMGGALVALRIAYVPSLADTPRVGDRVAPDRLERALVSLDEHAIKLAAACLEGERAGGDLPWGAALAKALV